MDFDLSTPEGGKLSITGFFPARPYSCSGGPSSYYTVKKFIMNKHRDNNNEIGNEIDNMEKALLVSS